MKKMDVYAYAKLTKCQKHELLEREGTVVDVDQEKNDVVYLYFVCGFFVEITLRNGMEIEHLPYKRGFKMAAVYEVAA